MRSSANGALPDPHRCEFDRPKRESLWTPGQRQKTGRAAIKSGVNLLSIEMSYRGSLRVGYALSAGSRRFHYDASQRGRRQFPEGNTVGRRETTKLEEIAASRNRSDTRGRRIGAQ